MKKLFILISLLCSFSILADNHVTGYSVMESFQCKLKNGKSMKDVARVDEEWNKWMNESGDISVQYNAWRMVSLFQNQKDFDFTHGWLGFTNNYEDMGTIQDEWLASGASMQAKFDRVEDCTAVHSMNYVYLVRAAKEPFQDGFMTVSGCKLSDDATNEKFIEADAKWLAYIEENGYSDGVFMRWMPGSGSGIDYPYDFLNVSVIPTFKEWGQNVDKLVTGGGAVSNSLYGNLQSCDTPRVYRTTYAGGYNPD